MSLLKSGNGCLLKTLLLVQDENFLNCVVDQRIKINK